MSKDTIYRQDAVDAINELHDKPNAWLDLAVEALEKLPSAEPEPHWIPTSKERPPQHQEIWITDDLGIVKLVYGKVGVWWVDENYYTEPEIIAWMPANVPSPYQPEEE